MPQTYDSNSSANCQHADITNIFHLPTGKIFQMESLRDFLNNKTLFYSQLDDMLLMPYVIIMPIGIDEIKNALKARRNTAEFINNLLRLDK